VIASAESELEQAALRAARAREAQLERAHQRALGVVHTPLPLVHFGLERVERALVEDFGLSGLDSEQLLVLDPAAGTGLWLAALLARLRGRGRPAGVIGIEADAAALESAQTLLAPEAQRLGVPLTLRRANTLALRDPWPSEALRVIVGNPPWGARSLSRGLALSDAWLGEFRHDHTGAALAERRSGVLSDDYVRFFRWALEQARQAPQGALVCLVTNGSYLAGPVHRGMRAALAAAFARIEVFDFGGNPRTSRGSEPDEGVFPVRLGAALTLLVRPPRACPGLARVTFTRLRGRRADKLAALAAPGLPAEQLAPAAPWFQFRPLPRTLDARAGFSLEQAFPFHREGVQTNRDAIATAPTRALLLERLGAIARGELALAGARHFDPQLARARIARALERDPETCIGTFWYRPFEARAYVTEAPLCHRPRPHLARAAAASELCLLSSRKEPGGAAWNMFAAVRGSADSSFLSTRSACRTRVFPSHSPDGEPNLARSVVERLGELLGAAPAPVQVIHYVLGVLGAPLFRAEHQAALKLDYPRLPWPRDARGFSALASAGERFVALLEGPDPAAPAGLAVEGVLPAAHELRRSQLRHLTPGRLRVAAGAEISAGPEGSLDAQVGHHRLVELAYGARGSATLPALLRACARALMWSDAEKAADAAYLS
jgi:SAM-dependent methyltransferase